MRTILVVGIGAGDPDYMTIQAIKALNRADVFFIPDKGAEKAALRQAREDICARFIERSDYRMVDFETPKRRAAGDDYLGAVDDWHARLADAYAALFTQHLAEGQCGAFLVWGDPSLYDSTIRILDKVRAGGFALEVEMIPGITAIQALTARHGLPLNRIGEPVLVTTGRRIAGGFPEDADSVVVMLDGEQAFTRLIAADLDIHWGAYLGTPDEILISGRLADVSEKIVRVRSEARSAHGWIMDTYLLRRRDG